MKPSYHVAASALSCAGVYMVTRSPLLAAVNFFSGILLDLDHVPEFLIKNRFQKGIRSFFKDEMHLADKKTYLLLHGYDVLTLLFALGWWAGWPEISLSIYIGVILHLMLDQIYNPVRTPFAFFLIYRIRHGFDTDAIYHRIGAREWWRQRKKG